MPFIEVGSKIEYWEGDPETSRAAPKNDLDLFWCHVSLGGLYLAYPRIQFNMQQCSTGDE